MIKFLFRYKRRIIAVAMVFIVLLAGLVLVKEISLRNNENAVVQTSSTATPSAEKKSKVDAKKSGNVKLKEAKDDMRATNEPVDAKTGKVKRPKSNSQTCTLIVKCDDVLQNTQMLNPEKAGIIPDTGIIYHTEYAEFHEGESVFDVFKREMKQEKLHFDYDESTLGGAFVSGIGNLYNGDCGANSGWMYYVNGVIPEVGCSQYTLQGGDLIEWIYICDMNTLF